MTPRLRVVLSSETSRRNKIALLADTTIAWKWQGRPYCSRLLIFVDSRWQECKSFDEDVLPTYKSGMD